MSPPSRGARASTAPSRKRSRSEAVVITLGMIETWWDLQSQLYVHTMPYLLTRNAMPRFQFERLNFQTCYDYVIKTLDLLDSTGRKNYLITTSPVALARTFSEDDILIANNYSKSVLRAVAGQVVEERDNVDYFPSYESVMLTKQGYVWEDDLAHVSYNFVGRIVNRVSEFYVDANARPASQVASEITGANADAELLFTGVMQYGDVAKAGEIFQSLKFDPLISDNPLFHTQVARLLMKQGKREPALAHARKAAATLSTFKREQVLAAEALRWAGAVDESNEFLQRVFESVADTPELALAGVAGGEGIPAAAGNAAMEQALFHRRARLCRERDIQGRPADRARAQERRRRIVPQGHLARSREPSALCAAGQSADRHGAARRGDRALAQGGRAGPGEFPVAAAARLRADGIGQGQRGGCAIRGGCAARARRRQGAQQLRARLAQGGRARNGARGVQDRAASRSRTIPASTMSSRNWKSSSGNV